MIEAGDMALLRPCWLVGALVTVDLAPWYRRRAWALGGWERAVDPLLLAALERLGQVIAGPGRRSRAAAAILLALALCGPAKQSHDAESLLELDGLVFVLELSPSLTEGGHLEEMLTAARLLSAGAASLAAGLGGLCR